MDWCRDIGCSAEKVEANKMICRQVLNGRNVAFYEPHDLRATSKQFRVVVNRHTAHDP